MLISISAEFKLSTGQDVTQNVMSQDYRDETEKGFKLFQKISNFAEKHFKGTEVATKIAVCLILL